VSASPHVQEISYRTGDRVALVGPSPERPRFGWDQIEGDRVGVTRRRDFFAIGSRRPSGYAATVNAILDARHATKETPGASASSVSAPRRDLRLPELRKNSNSVVLKGRPVGSLFGRRALARPLRIENDAPASPSRRPFDGAAREASVVFA